MSTNDRHSQLKAEFERIYQEKSQGEVRERTAVLEEFLRTEGHVTAQDLAQRLERAGTHVPLDRVALLLAEFVRYGVARRVEFEGHPTRYEHLHLEQIHDHLVCVKCGAILEVEDPRLDQLQSDLIERFGFRGFRRKLVIYGFCRSCGRTAEHAHPLITAALGERVEVVGFTGGGAIEQRLTTMGLRAGIIVEILQRTDRGPVILACGDTRLAVDQDLARRVQVRTAVEPARPGEARTNSDGRRSFGLGLRLPWRRGRDSTQT